jgi:hypothetical protein
MWQFLELELECDANHLTSTGTRSDVVGTRSDVAGTGIGTQEWPP